MWGRSRECGEGMTGEGECGGGHVWCGGELGRQDW